jgi:Sodium/hydrogen exchanger family.
MEFTFVSLLVITAIAFVGPLIAALFPNRILPETVLFLVGGMVLGPYVLDVIIIDHAITLLSDLGLGFLFLLAGYELDMKDLVGAEGRSAVLPIPASVAS